VTWQVWLCCIWEALVILVLLSFAVPLVAVQVLLPEPSWGGFSLEVTCSSIQEGHWIGLKWDF
jgi:hypothetical protein